MIFTCSGYWAQRGWVLLVLSDLWCSQVVIDGGRWLNVVVGAGMKGWVVIRGARCLEMVLDGVYVVLGDGLWCSMVIYGAIGVNVWYWLVISGDRW